MSIPTAVCILAVTACGAEESVVALATGSVRIEVHTTGQDIDPDGYSLVIGSAVRPVAAHGVVTVEGLPAGAVRLELAGVASNCSLDGPNPRTLDVIAGSMVASTFDVECTAQSPRSWQRVADMPTPRLALAVAAVNGELFAIGGYQAANAPGLGTVGRYDTATNEWTARALMPTGRRWVTGAVANGRIYVIGGHVNVGAPSLPTVEEYDPAADAWTKRGHMPTARRGATAAVLDGMIWVVGGYGSAPLATVEVYDPATDTWTARAPMPTPRVKVALEVVDGRLYAIGGGPDPATGMRTVEIYDPATDSWSAGAPMPTPRSSACSGVVDGRIIVIGGADGGRANAVVLDAVEEYDPVTDTWTSKDAMPTPRFALACAVLGEKIYTVGGSLQVQVPHPGVPVVAVFDPRIR